MVESDTLAVTIVLIDVSFAWGLAGYAIYWMVQYHKIHFLPVIAKREYILQISVNICLLLAMCIVQPSSMVWTFLSERSPQSNIVKNSYNFFYIFGNIMWFVAYFGAVILFPTRLFFLYYNLKYSVALSQGKWVHSLNTSSVVMDKSLTWFIQASTRKTYGNSYWLYTRIVLPIYIIEFFVYLILQFSNLEGVQRLVSNGSFAVCIAMLVYFWCKLPNYMDYIYLKREIQYLLLGGFLLGLLYMLYTVALVADPNNKILSKFGYLACVSPLSAMVCSGCVFMDTYGVLKWNDLLSFLSDLGKPHQSQKDGLEDVVEQHPDDWNTHEELRQIVRIRYTMHANRKPLTIPSRSSKDHRKNGSHENSRALSFLGSHAPNAEVMQLKLRDILTEKHRIEVFMEFLCREFCQENLLMIIELVQFKEYIRAYKNMRRQNEPFSHTLQTTDDHIIENLKMEHDLQIILAEDIVQSEIVFASNLTVQEKFQKLVRKYITMDAPLSVNISFSQRLNIIRKYEVSLPSTNTGGTSIDGNFSTTNTRNEPTLEEIEEYIYIFDDCLREIICLLKDSFGRFILTDMYKKLCEEA